MYQWIFILLAILTVSGCQESGDVPKTPIKAVKVKAFDGQTDKKTHILSGVVQMGNKADLSFSVGGCVAKMQGDVGFIFEREDVLAQLDHTEFDLNYLSTKATLDSTMADLKEKEYKLRQYQKLKEKHLVSDAALEKVQAAWLTALNQMQISQLRFESAKLNLQKTAVKAPFSGQISKRYIEPLTEVKAGQPIVEIQGQSVLQVEALMPDTLIEHVFLGQEITVGFPMLRGIELSAKIAYIGKDVGTEGALLIRGFLQEAPELVQPGMTAVLSMVLDDKKTATYKLPLSAINLKNDRGKKQVAIYIFDESNHRAKRRLIQVGEIFDDEVEVIEGLTEGELVIIAGVPFLEEGQLVAQSVSAEQMI